MRLDRTGGSIPPVELGPAGCDSSDLLTVETPVGAGRVSDCWVSEGGCCEERMVGRPGTLTETPMDGFDPVWLGTVWEVSTGGDRAVVGAPGTLLSGRDSEETGGGLAELCAGCVPVEGFTLGTPREGRILVTPSRLLVPGMTGGIKDSE